MSQKKLNRLFRTARQAAPPALSASFADDVLRAIRHEPLVGSPSQPSLFEQLNVGFSRSVGLTAVIFVLGVAVNLALGTQEVADCYNGAIQMSAQWLVLPPGM